MIISATSEAAGGYRTAATNGPEMAVLMEVNRWDQRSDGTLNETTLLRKLATLGYDPLPHCTLSGAIVSARTHHRDRAAAVVAGLLQVTIESESVILTAGDIVIVPDRKSTRLNSSHP